MMRYLHKLIPLCFTVTLTTGCALNRANLTSLSQEQQRYYEELGKTLEAGRTPLALGLDEQIEVNRARRANLMEWERDLQRAEVLLQVDANVTGNQKLLMMKLAQLNLQANQQFVADRTSEQQKDAVLALYDKLTAAVSRLQQNNDLIVEYLDSGDASFALRSLDIDGVVGAITGIQNTREQLGVIRERSDEEKQAEQQRIRESIARARDVLLQAFRKN